MLASHTLPEAPTRLPEQRGRRGQQLSVSAVQLLEAGLWMHRGWRCWVKE